MTTPDRLISELELRRNTGGRGSRKFIAYNGIVYDITDCPKWRLDMHENLHFPGQDLTEAARAVLQNVNRVVVENQDSVRNAVKNIEAFSAALSESTKRIDSIMSGLEMMVNKDGKGELQAAVTSFKELSDNLDKRTAEISAGVNKFTATGTQQITVLISDARKTLGDISVAFRNLDRNPSRLLFGGAPPASTDARAQQRR